MSSNAVPVAFATRRAAPRRRAPGTPTHDARERRRHSWPRSSPRRRARGVLARAARSRTRRSSSWRRRGARESRRAAARAGRPAGRTLRRRSSKHVVLERERAQRHEREGRLTDARARRRASVVEPATNPPPSTRSSSPRPDEVSGASSRRPRHAVRSRHACASRALDVAAVTSSIEFHSPQPPQRPCQRGAFDPQRRQT